MSDESTPEKEPSVDTGSQSIAAKAWRESVANARKVMENTETVTGSNRQLVDAGSLGTCLVFLAALLGVQKIDTSLTISLVAFAVAIPFLADGFLWATYKPKPDREWRLFVALQTGAWIAEGFGWIGVAVGVFFVIAHLSLLALNAFIASIVLVAIGVPFLSLVGLIIYAMVQYKKQEDKKQEKTASAATGDAPTQQQQIT